MSEIIEQICNVSGVPGASIGILHQGDVIFTENFGHRDVEAQIPPTKDTVYGIGSLTKSFVAAGLTTLLDREKKISLETPVDQVFPDFHLRNSSISRLVTISDFLSHRSGLLGDMSLAVQGDIEMLLQPSDLIPTINDLESSFEFRRDWSYNNWGYSIAGAIIETVSKKPFHESLHELVLNPLGLKHTTTQPNFRDDENIALAYNALSDGELYSHPRRSAFQNSIFEAAGGLYSTVDDLLTYARFVLAADKTTPSDGPLKHVPLLISNQIPLENPCRDNRFYGFGWIRTELPGVVGRQGDNADLFDIDELPLLGSGSPSQMVYYHQGSGIGYYSVILLFPQTQSAIVVLTNSIPLSDAPDWISQVYAAALFDFPSPASYLDLAKEARHRRLAQFDALLAKLESIRDPDAPPSFPLERYLGVYRNTAQNFLIQVHWRNSTQKALSIAFQGRDTQVYSLRHLHDDVFEWAMSYDESAKRARFPIADHDYFLVEFRFHESSHERTLIWGKIPSARPDGISLYDRDGATCGDGRKNGWYSFLTSTAWGLWQA